MARKSPTIAAVRGATTVRANTAPAIREATARLLRALIDANHLRPERIVSALFTSTADLDADFPAHAARLLGWHDVPLLGAQELPVRGAMARVVRVLLTLDGAPRRGRLVPVYLDGASALRPDLAAPTDRAAPRGTRARAARGKRVALIGLGQIGGSIGLALGRPGGWHRIGWDRDKRVLQRARTANAIDAAASSLKAALAGAELVVLATPVDTLPALIERASRALRRGAVLLDTGSTRGAVQRALERAAERGVRAVGGHPLAGTEGHGFAAARADLFQRTTFVLVPTRRGIPPIVRTFVRALGARPIQARAERHDAALARTSHLPYLLACALRDLGSVPARAGFHGPTFRDMTRVAASDPRVAMAYCRANATEVEAAWRTLRDRMSGTVGSLVRRRRF